MLKSLYEDGEVSEDERAVGVKRVILVSLLLTLRADIRTSRQVLRQAE